MSLTLQSINKSFDKASVIRDFSYSFKDSGIYIVKGKSGIGKTTLLRIICGLEQEYTGNITDGGVEKCSFMFQEYRLFPTLSAFENAIVSISPSDDAKREYAEALLLRLGFDKKDFQKKPRELSGGMKQRIAFTRAVIHSSKILLLDEPTKELNREIIEVMADIIKDEARERLVILVTHDDILEFLPNSEIINL